MKALLQRVNEAFVTVDNQKIADIGKGLLIFLGIMKEDNDKDIAYLVDKIINMRIFEGKDGKFDLSLKEINGEVLIISQFTLCADCKKGRRPDFGNAANPDDAESLYKKTIKAFENTGIVTRQGKFRAFMQISLINDGPVTIYLDSKTKLI